MIKSTTLVIVLANLCTIMAAVSLQKRDGDHDHGHDIHVSSGYSPPSTGYEEPAHSAYDPPAQAYSTGYDTPSTSYGEPSYNEPSYGASYETPFPDITPIIIGILALLGLSLLFPNNVRIDNVRKKRSAAEGKMIISE